jgi:hypothetical protein
LGMVRSEALAHGESRQSTVTPAPPPDAQGLYSTRLDQSDMKAGRLSLVFGLTQIVIMAMSPWVSDAWGHPPDAILMVLFGLCMLTSIVLASVSLHRQERPLWWAVSGMTLSLLWVAGYTTMWVLSALS